MLLHFPYMSTRTLPANTITFNPIFIKYPWTCFHYSVALILEHARGTLTKEKKSRGLIAFETICEDDSNASLSWLCWACPEIVAFHAIVLT